MFEMQSLATSTDESQAQMRLHSIKIKLDSVLSAQVAYCEGDKNHPFLEEVISLYSHLFESLGDHRSAIYMWQYLLAIQEKMFGETRRQMFTTLKKLGSLYFQSGNPVSASKFFERAQNAI